MAYTQANYVTGPGYYPQHNPGHAFPNLGFKTSVKMHTCDFCDYQSNKPFNVRRHMERNHLGKSGGVIKPSGESMENTQQPPRLYQSGYIEKNIHGMSNEQNKSGGVIVENTQQPPRFYPSKHIERNHPEMVNTQNTSGEGPLQNIYYTDRYSGRDKYEKQRNDIVKNTNQLGSEVDSRKISDNYYKEDIEKLNPRGNGQVRTDFRGFGQVKPNINKIDKYKLKVPFEYLKEDYENVGHDILRKQFEWLKSVTPDLFTYVISELNLHHRPYKNSTGHNERNNQRSGGTMQNDGGAVSESSDFRSQMVGQRKYEKYS
jgi:hypothetical protein